MNNAFSNYAETKILDYVLRGQAFTSPTNVFLGLHYASPGEAGGNEIGYTGYTRATLSFGNAASRQIATDANCTFGTMTAGSATVSTYYGIYDAFSAGNLLAYGSLSVAKQIVSGNKPSVASGQVICTLASGGMSTSLANAILDHVFNATAMTQPTIFYVALCTATIYDGTISSAMSEASGGSYARGHAGGGTTGFTVSGNSATNTAIITFPTPTSPGWGTITTAVLINSTSSGMILFYDNNIQEQQVTVSDTVQFAAGAFQITLD